MSAAGPNRLQRLLGGWSATLAQLALSILQQLALVPIFLHYRSSDMLAAWLALYAAGSLVLIADAGLMLRTVNRFLAFKSCVDCDGRTAQFFRRVQGIYLGLTGVLVAAFTIGALLLRPSYVFGFRAVTDFDLSFVLMTAGMVLLLPSNLATALYRACADAARTAGFRRLELMATAPGEPLYTRLGFAVIERIELPLPPDVLLPLARMARSIAAEDFDSFKR